MSLFTSLIGILDKVEVSIEELLNGHVAIDLGITLDNGNHLLFADKNIGASSPEDYGDYFMWSSIVPNNSSKCYWDDPNLPYHTGTSSTSGWSKYYGDINSTVLELEDDVVHVTMGGHWRMPSDSELYKLKVLTNIWTTENGVLGRKWTVNNNTLFIPAAGCRYNGAFSNQGTYSYLWCNNLYAASLLAYSLYFYNSYMNTYKANRCYGYSIRGVIELTPAEYNAWIANAE